MCALGSSDEGKGLSARRTTIETWTKCGIVVTGC